MKNVDNLLFRALGLMVTFLVLSGPVLAQLTPDSIKTMAVTANLNNTQVSQDSNPLITLKVDRVSLREALKRIAGQAEAGLYYNTVLLPDKTVSLRLQAVPLGKALRKVLAGTSLRVVTSGRNITLRPKRKKNKIQLKQVNKQETITGTVTDASTGNTMPGVNIRVKGTTTGTSTDAQGQYELTVESLQDTLVFSFVGYQSQTILINGRTEINIEMQSQTISGQELVVVGYGTQQTQNVTGSISSVSADEIDNVSSGDVVSKLKGRVAGVQVAESYAPGGNSTIRIRGIGTVGNNDPLFIVDGVPVPNLDGINPNSIESISVLKDAASAAIYGSRAANGVVLVTTKRGEKEQKMSLSFRGHYGVQRVRNTVDMLNTRELGQLKWLVAKNDGLEVGDPGWGDVQYGYGPKPVIPDYIFPAGTMEEEVDESNYNYPDPYYGITKANKEGTDWQNEIFRAAPTQKYYLTLSGGSNYANYSVSAGFEDQSGILKYTGYKQYNLRANSDFDVSNWLKIGQSLGAIYSIRKGQTGYGAIFNAQRLSPIVPIKDIHGNFAGTQSKGTGNDRNPIAQLYRNKNNFSRKVRLIPSAYAQIDFADFLDIETKIGADIESNLGKNYDLIEPEIFHVNLTNALHDNSDRLFQFDWTNTITFDKTINNDHSFNVLLGSEIVKNEFRGFGARRSSFQFQNTDYMVLDAGESNINNNETFDEWSLFSYFARLNYNYKGKYLLKGVVRRDGSSRFASDNRWGTFPAFSVGWRMLEDLGHTSFLDGLKLRFGWGKNGNDNVGNYNQYSTYTSNPNVANYAIDGSNTSSQSGFWQNRVGNVGSKWETSTTTNLGIDVSLVDSRLKATIDIYKRKTTDMLYPERRPTVLGQASTPDVNIGEIKNTGIDLNLSYKGKAGKDFDYNIGLTFSHYKNKVIKLLNDPSEFRYGNDFLNDPYTITTAGEPVSSFYGWVQNGYFNTKKEIEEYPKFSPDAQGNDSYSRLGAFKYEDVNGDGVITADDRTIIGSPHPDFTYGLSINLNYKAWDMNLFFQGSQGNEIMNFRKRQLMFTRYGGNFMSDRLYNSWTTERYANGEKITAPISTNSDETLSRPSTWFLEDGSYLKLKRLQIGYNLPKQIISRMNVQNIRIYFAASNLFTITNYSGMDPELNNDNGDLSIGVDTGLYPPSRILSVGLNFNF